MDARKDKRSRTASRDRSADAAARAQRIRRLQLFGGISVIGAIVVAVVIAIASSGSGTNRRALDVANGHTHDSAIESIDRAVSAELDGIPQNGTVLGSPTAKVTMEYFGDLQCPVCAAFSSGADITGADGPGGLPQFIAEQVRRGEVKIDYRSLCTATCSSSNPSPGGGSDAFTRQQVAAYAAGAQRKFWYFAEIFYREQGSEDSGYVTSAFIDNVAKQVPGLNLRAWEQDRSDRVYVERLIADDRASVRYGLNATPALEMIGPRRSVLVNGGNFADYNDLVTAYKEVS